MICRLLVKLLSDWVNCTYPRCGKWMHAQCLEIGDGLYSCGLCGDTAI